MPTLSASCWMSASSGSLTPLAWIIVEKKRLRSETSWIRVPFCTPSTMRDRSTRVVSLAGLPQPMLWLMRVFSVPTTLAA